MTRRALAAALAASAMLTAAPAIADDDSAGVAPGRLHAVPRGTARLETVAVELDGDRVRIALTTTTDTTTTVTFALPAFTWLGEAETYPDRQLPELTVEVDGRRTTPAETFRATVGGVDVTSLVRDAGVDPFTIADTPPFVSPRPGRGPAFAALTASGAVATIPEGTVARWSAARTVRTTIGRGRHTIAFRYDARPGIALTTSASNTTGRRDRCLDVARGAALPTSVAHGPVLVRSYVIPVALNGRRAVRTTLRTNTHDGAVTIVCGIDGLRLVDPVSTMLVRPGADGLLRIVRFAAQTKP